MAAFSSSIDSYFKQYVSCGCYHKSESHSPWLSFVSPSPRSSLDDD